MDEKTYIAAVIDEMAERLSSEGLSIEMQNVLKTNTVRQGIVIRPLVAKTGITASPVLYTDVLAEFYHTGHTVDQAVQEALTLYRSAPVQRQSEHFAKAITKDFVLENCYLMTVNRDKNEQLLADTPHVDIPGTDLSSYVRVRIDDAATCRVSYTQLYNLGLQPQELLQAAVENNEQTHYTCRPMGDVLGMDCMDMDQPAMMVLATDAMVEGASVLLRPDVLDQAQAALGCDKVYLLPSSVHEMLAVSDAYDPEELREMVIAINANASIIAPEDVLSDEVYQYDGRALTIARDQHERERSKSR